MTKPTAVTRFQTSDAKLFSTPEEAQAHEDFLRVVKEFPNCFRPYDGTAKASPYEILITLFRKYPLPPKE